MARLATGRKPLKIFAKNFKRKQTGYIRNLMNYKPTAMSNEKQCKYTDYPDAVYIYHDMPFRVVIPPKPTEPRLKVSPYAKFNKYHKKKKK